MRPHFLYASFETVSTQKQELYFERFKSGHIIVFTGLLHFVANDDELAAVIGHELSHVSG